MEDRCKNSHEYDQEAEDAAVAELIVQREEEENLQRQAEEKLQQSKQIEAEEAD